MKTTPQKTFERQSGYRLGVVLSCLCLAPAQSPAKWEPMALLAPFMDPEVRARRVERRQLNEWVRGISDRELADTRAELKRQGNDNSIKEMTRAARAEIYRRASEGRSPTREFWAAYLKARLTKALEGAKAASDFFDVFDDTVQGTHPRVHGSILGHFVTVHISSIMALGPSPKQLKNVRRYTTDASIILIGALLSSKRSGEFFVVLDRVARQYNDKRSKRNIAMLISTSYAKDIMALRPSDIQLGRLIVYLDEVDSTIALLEAGLKRVKSAKGFLDIFDKIFDSAWFNPSDELRRAFTKFIVDNADSIIALNPSAYQIRRIASYENRIGSSMALLQAGLGRAKSANDFIAVFNAVGAVNPTRKYRRTLEKFMIDNSEAISALDLSFEQVATINHYIDRGDLFDVLTVGNKMGKSCAGATAALLAPGAPGTYGKAP